LLDTLAEIWISDGGAHDKLYGPSEELLQRIFEAEKRGAYAFFAIGLILLLIWRPGHIPASTHPEPR
jgi:hypothetical protein